MINSEKLLNLQMVDLILQLVIGIGTFLFLLIGLIDFDYLLITALVYFILGCYQVLSALIRTVYALYMRRVAKYQKLYWLFVLIYCLGATSLYDNKSEVFFVVYLVLATPIAVFKGVHDLNLRKELWKAKDEPSS